MLKLPIYNIEGKKTEDVSLDKSVFDGEVNKAVLYQVISCYQANLHFGNAATKTRGEVSGGGKKPWRQKGTGRARAGSTRSPLWRHGGVIFGPHPRIRGFEVPKRTKIIALKSSLNAKLKKGDLLLIDETSFNNCKTKQIAAILSKLPNLTQRLKLVQRTLGVFRLEPQVLRCMRNIKNLELVRPVDVTAYDVLKSRKVLISKDGLSEIVRRISGKNMETQSRKE